MVTVNCTVDEDMIVELTIAWGSHRLSAKGTKSEVKVGSECPQQENWAPVAPRLVVMIYLCYIE